MEPLLKSDKAYQTPAQEAQLTALIEGARVQFDARRGDLSSFEVSIPFTPTQEWLDRFAELGLRFLPDNSVPYAAFTVVHRSNERFADVPKKEAPWVPQNGEEIQAEITAVKDIEPDWYDCFYIGNDFTNGAVVRLIGPNSYHCVDFKRIRKKVIKTQVPLAELLSVYASVKGLTQDGVELKPEN